MTLEESLTPYERFIQSVENPYTRHGYVCGLKWFLEFTKTTPDELVKASPMAIEDSLKRLIKHMEQIGKSWGSRAAVVNALRKFLRTNKVKDVDWDELRKRLGEDESEHDDQPYSRELIQRLMQAADLRKKVIVGVLATAGIRRSALPPLKLKHTKKLQLPNNAGSIYSLDIYANSKRSRYVTFVTPEVTAIIDTYLESRKAAGETLGPESPLIREQFDKESVNKPRHITQSTTAQLVQGLIIQAGVKQEIRENKIHTMHAFRKRVYTELIKAGVKEVNVKRVVGHSTGLGRNYDRQTIDVMLQDYAKAIPNLMISDSADLKRRVDELTTKVSDFEQMKQLYLSVKAELDHEKENKIDVVKRLSDELIVLRHEVEGMKQKQTA